MSTDIEGDEPFARTMHVGIPVQATAEERERLEDLVVTAAYGMEPRGAWDSFAWSHDGECITSDHCCGPDSALRKAERKGTPRLWRVVASVTTERTWVSTSQVPIFYIDPLIQGALTEEDAVKVAYDIITSCNDGAKVTVHTNVEPVD